MATHKEITNLELRTILANELSITRNLCRMGVYDSDSFFWLRVGLFTLARRIQYAQDNKAQAKNG